MEKKQSHEHKKKASTARKRRGKKKENTDSPLIRGLMIVSAILIVFNQVQIGAVAEEIRNLETAQQSATQTDGEADLSAINLDELKSTGHTLAAVFPVENIETVDDAMAMIFPTGTPDYGEEMGVSYDKPVESLAVLARMYRGLKAEVQQNNPEGWERFMNLASRPVGISCEYCCGLRAVGIDKQGNSACGCQHNPALLSVALYLSAYSDYTDGEILREVMKWKTLFFPKNMMELAMTVAGGDTSQLENLPGMVGGC